MTRKRDRGRTTGPSGGSLLRNVTVSVIVIAMASLVVQSAAFDTFQGVRSSNVDAVGDGTALVGVDRPEFVPVDGDSGPCSFGPAVLNVTKTAEDDIDTTRDVVILDKVNIDITTSGSVRIEPGARVDGDVEAGGCVIVENGARAEGDVEAGGAVTIQSGGRAKGDVDAGGDLTLQPGSRITGDAEADGSVTVRSGARIDGGVDAGEDVAVESGARVEDDVEAGGAVTVQPGGWVGGDISEGDGSSSTYPRLVTLTNNQESSIVVTITLLDSGDGEFVVDGSHVGDSTTFTILSGGSDSIHIDPEAGAGPDISFRVESSNTADGTTVTLERSVPTA